jgi:hypothetical protein
MTTFYDLNTIESTIELTKQGSYSSTIIVPCQDRVLNILFVPLLNNGQIPRPRFKQETIYDQNDKKRFLLEYHYRSHSSSLTVYVLGRLSLNRFRMTTFHVYNPDS